MTPDGEASMDTERNLLFGVVAFQNGAVDADRLAETCAAWVEEPSQPLANLFVNRGLMTDEQKTELEKVVAHELDAHGGDPQATLAATMDARSLEAIRDAAGPNKALEAQFNLSPQAQNGHVVLGTLSPGDESRERYTLTHLHAKGGMGRVWLARDGALGRQIALKELRPDQTDNSIVCSRFLYEAKITAQLEHPGIVPVYELGEGDAPYYTMRFVRGRTLSEAIRAYHKKRAAGEADSVGRVELLTAFVNVCHAVAYAHSRGIIHRDLKGQNVVLGDFGEVMVLDWGLAKRVGPDQQADSSAPEMAVADPAPGPAVLPALDGDPYSAATCDTGANPDKTLPESHDIRSGSGALSNGSAKSYSNPSSNGSGSQSSGRQANRESGAGPEGTMQGQLLGTPAYMAPEQAQGRHDLVNERTDVYGLGAILYEILTGRPPFIAPKTSEIIRKVCQEAPTPPRQILATIPPGLEGVCMKALRKASSERYVTAAELAQEVQRYLADEPVQAYAEPWTTRVLRWARRHKTMVSAAAALLVTATTALAVSTVLISQEKTEAEAQGQQARHAVHMLTKVADIGFDDQLDPLQKEFLEEALQYYELFTSRVANDPGVRLEHGRAYQQMGDIQRKLGRLPESKKAYLKAVEILEPLARSTTAGAEPRRALARSQTLLADLLVRTGSDKDQAEPLYSKALEAQQTLAKAQGATTEDQLRLGQTLKSQGDLLRLEGHFAQSKPVYDQAIAVLEQARNADTKHSEVRNSLALATDARGWIHLETGDATTAEQDYRFALGLLDTLVADFPTMPRYRQSLAKACNSLALIELGTGRLPDAETHLRRELPLVERLAQDFPEQPEHRRELARTLTNLGSVLIDQSGNDDAEPIFDRAIKVNTEITAKNPDDVQIRLDLAKCHLNLGEFLRRGGNTVRAIESFRQARSITEALAKASPDKPRYLDLLAKCLVNLGLALEVADPPRVEETYNAALAIYEKLVKDYPENVDYQAGMARCLENLGPVVANAGRPEQAETMYRKALTLLETNDARSRIPAWMRYRAGVLSNLGHLRRPGAEDAFKRSIGLSANLAESKPLVLADIHSLAIAQNNLAQLFVEQKRLPEAEALFAQSVTGFEKLATQAPKSIDYQKHFGYVLEKQAGLMAQTGKIVEAKTALASAVDHQRQAMKLSRNRADVRELLGSHLLELAQINLKLGAYKDAAANALDLPNAVPASARDQGCFDAARILARLVSQVDSDGKLTPDERQQLTRNYLGRTVVLLREAVDTNPKLADQIKADSDIKVLRSHPEFQAIMNTLVSVGK
jgi:eukaryotic-like serine/threonine-protein kinase